MKQQNTDGFFLYLPCAGGYYSYYGSFFNPETAEKIYVINGGITFGTDIILKSVLKQAEKYSYTAEKIYNHIYPNILEAIGIPELKIYIVNGTVPGKANGKYPIIVEKTVNADDFFDIPRILKNADKIKMLSNSIETEKKRCINYLTAVRSVYSDSFALLNRGLNKDKLQRYAQRFAAREFPVNEKKPKKAKMRFLSCITPSGIYTNYDSIKRADRIISIDDSIGVASSALINELTAQAESRGLDCILCKCQTNPEGKSEHLIIPEANIAFFTSNKYHKAPENTERCIHTSRFIDRDIADACRFRLNFNKKACGELIAEAVNAEKAVKELQDILYGFYLDALNREKLDIYINKLTEKIFLPEK